MSDDTNRVMPSVSERTMVPGTDLNSTQMLSVDPLRTQMGAVTTCPVCKTTVPAMEKYCSDCGYLLEAGEPPAPDLAVVAGNSAPAELFDPADGRTYPLRSGTTTIGRQGADIITTEGTVSRLHAKVTVDGGRVIIEDLGSSNGTRVEGARILPNTAVEVEDGANIRLGNWKLVLNLLVSNAVAEQTIDVAAAVGNQPEEDLHEGAEAEPLTATEPEPVAVLRWTEGPGVDVLIPAGTITLGRRPENTIVLTGDQYVSGRHASLSASVNRLILTDDGSRNGTLVNGDRLQEHQPVELFAGDTIKIGQTTYQLAFVTSNTSQQENVVPHE